MATTKVPVTITIEAMAAQYVADMLYGGLIQAGDPQKASELARMANHPAVDLKLTRVVLVTHPSRFTSMDRKWTLWSRFSDPTRSLARNLEDVTAAYGMPMTIGQMACELSAIYQRSPEYYEEMLPRTLASVTTYFKTEASFGLNKWLLIADGETEEDVLFDNYLKAFQLEAFAKSAKLLKPNNIDSVVAFLDVEPEPIDSKILQFLMWRACGGEFNPQTFFVKLLADDRLAKLSCGMWAGPKHLERFVAEFAKIADREVDEHGDLTVKEAALPLEIKDDEREQLVLTVLNNTGASRAVELLESVFEVEAGDTTYHDDLITVLNALKEDDRIIWAGADRFLPTGSIPEYVYSVPEALQIPGLHYVDAEGNDVDVLLEEDGFDGGLQREVLMIVAQDVLDEEAVYEPEMNPPATARCVLKFHHKEIGTYPLCQLPPGFFPVEARILQADLTLPSGHKIEIWINNETRLVYGLLDWYHTLPIDSGAVFYLERQAADKFVLTYGEETEPSMFISRNRVNELLDLGNRAHQEELPTFDIVRQIMEHYRKGIEFITLLTEVNISRRTSRRMVASVLSGHHCYFQRGGAWVFDLKKFSQGFDKSKRKYVKK